MRKFVVAKQAHPSASLAEWRAVKDVIAKRYVRALRKYLHICRFRNKAHCVMCDHECPISPRGVPGLQDAYWVETGGMVCKAFSALSNRAEYNRFLHPSTLVAKVYLYSTRFYEPDEIHLENVARFPWKFVRAIFRETQKGGGR